jgi:hypothetical protein
MERKPNADKDMKTRASSVGGARHKVDLSTEMTPQLFVLSVLVRIVLGVVLL